MLKQEHRLKSKHNKNPVLRILQTKEIITKLGDNWHINTEKIIKGRYVDHLNHFSDIGNQWKWVSPNQVSVVGMLHCNENVIIDTIESIENFQTKV